MEAQRGALSYNCTLSGFHPRVINGGYTPRSIARGEGVEWVKAEGSRSSSMYKDTKIGCWVVGRGVGFPWTVCLAEAAGENDLPPESGWSRRRVEDIREVNNVMGKVSCYQGPLVSDGIEDADGYPRDGSVLLVVLCAISCWIFTLLLAAIRARKERRQMRTTALGLTQMTATGQEPWQRGGREGSRKQNRQRPEDVALQAVRIMEGCQSGTMAVACSCADEGQSAVTYIAWCHTDVDSNAHSGVDKRETAGNNLLQQETDSQHFRKSAAVEQAAVSKSEERKCDNIIPPLESGIGIAHSSAWVSTRREGRGVVAVGGQGLPPSDVGICVDDDDDRMDFLGPEMCCVCLDKLPDLQLLPCKHRSECRFCLMRQLVDWSDASKPFCPLCRTVIEKICLDGAPRLQGSAALQSAAVPAGQSSVVFLADVVFLKDRPDDTDRPLASAEAII